MARCASRVATVSHWTAAHHKDRVAESSNHKFSHVPSKNEFTNEVISGGSPEDARNFLNRLVSRIEGLCAIFITDRDGIPILRASSSELPENASHPNFLATVSLAVDQAGKLGIGKNRRIVCSFDNFQVIHFNKCPLMVSLVATTKTNTGLLLNLETELSGLVDELRSAITV